MIYPSLLLWFIISSSNYFFLPGNSETLPQEQKPLNDYVSSPEERRKSKSIDLDDWYYWQSKKFSNRQRHRPYPPSLMSNYDQYYSMYPPPFYPMRNKPSRRNGLSISSPLTAPSSNSYSTTDTDGIQGVFAKWNPKINLTWPNIAVSSTNDYPDYSPSASYHHHDHDDHHRQIQFVPIHMPCNHEHGHGKKKEISLIWPLLFLGLLFFPLLLGALFLPLAFLFITNIIQLLNLLQRLQQPATSSGGGSGKRRKKRSTLNHPSIEEQIQLVADQLEKSLVKFLFLFSDDTSGKLTTKTKGKSKSSSLNINKSKF